MKTIEYLKGDATTPVGEGNKMIVHICNDIGGWGRGFVLAISDKWKKPEEKYREWSRSEENFDLGEIQCVQVEDNVWVVNMIAQRDIKTDKDGIPPIRYEALRACLKKVRDIAERSASSVHMPRIGCGLAGGKWEEIEPIIEEELASKDITVMVYDR